MRESRRSLSEKKRQLKEADVSIKNNSIAHVILYSEKNYQLIPDYVICIDNIDTESYNYAKENKLPIVIINSSKYKISRNYTDDIDYRDTYLTREEDYYGTSK